MIHLGNNYFVFITRDKRLTSVDYAVNEVYGFKVSSGQKTKFSIVKFYKLYNSSAWDIHPYVIITEDSKSGFALINEIFRNECSVKSAYGKDNIKNAVKNIDKQNIVYIIADGAAFGALIDDLIQMKEYRNIHIFIPESFEYLMLQTKVFRRYLTDELSKTYKYADSSKYFTWENYYTYLIKDICGKIPGAFYNKEDIKHLCKMFKSVSFIKELRQLIIAMGGVSN